MYYQQIHYYSFDRLSIGACYRVCSKGAGQPQCQRRKGEAWEDPWPPNDDADRQRNLVPMKANPETQCDFTLFFEPRKRWAAGGKAGEAWHVL